MSNNFMSDIESNESNVEKIVEEKETIETREVSIQRAILSLENDERLKNILHNNEQETERQKIENKEQINAAKSSIDAILTQISEERETCMNDRMKIETLSELGEDITDSMQILDDRSKILDECENRLQSLLEKLDMQESSQQTTLDSKENGESNSYSKEREGIYPTELAEQKEHKHRKVDNYYDDKGVQYADENGLKPNVSYTLNGYHYNTDNKGRINSVSGKLRLKPKDQARKSIRSSMEEISKGDHKEGDQRGHLFADMFDGSNKLGNFIAMDGVLNQGEFKSFELHLKTLIEQGADVQASIRLRYGKSARPTKLIVSVTINGHKHKEIFRN